MKRENLKESTNKKKPKIKLTKLGNRVKNISLLVISLLLIGCVIMAYPFLSETYAIKSNNNDQKEDIKKEEEPKEKVYTANMIMVGDALIHSSVYNDAYDKHTKSYDFTKQVSLIKPIVSKYDIAFYNQETILGGTELGLSNYPRFNSPYEVGDAMIDAGFNVVNLATNHTLDVGSKGVMNSCAYWAKHDDILTAGSYCSKEDQQTIRTATKNNISYALLSYTESTNGIPVPKGQEYLVNVYSDELAKKQIEEIRDKVDVLIVSMHWGEEYTHTPTNFEKEKAKYLASLGVDIIIGTHPHVVQPVEWIDNTLVFYSLGNFISAQRQNENYNKMVGLMPSLTITKTVNESGTKIKIDNIQNELIYTYYKNFRDFKVIPFSQMTSEYLSNYENIYERYAKVIKNYDDTMPVVGLN